MTTTNEPDALRRYVDSVIDSLTQEMHAQFKNAQWKQQIQFETFQQLLHTRLEDWIALRDLRWRNEAILARNRMMVYAAGASALTSAIVGLVGLGLWWLRS